MNLLAAWVAVCLSMVASAIYMPTAALWFLILACLNALCWRFAR